MLVKIRQNIKKEALEIKHIFIIFLFILLLPLQIYAQELPQTVQNALVGKDQKTKDALIKMFKSIPTKNEIERINILKSMEIKTTPISPKPYDKVDATLLNFSTDLNRAYIYWYVDGVLKEKGEGKTTFDFSVGGLGKTTKITTITKTFEGYRIVKSINVTPEELDITWETKTYTPPFYKGKAILTPKSVLKIIAMPNFVSNGQRISPSKLIYTWREDGEIVQKKSGYGKYIYYDEAPYLYKEKEISVEVSSFNKTINAYKKITMLSEIPEVIFYKNDPIEGVEYEKAIDTKFNINNQELSIIAEPYFFSIEDKAAGNIIYKWYLNNNKTSNSGQNATFRRENNKITGFSKIKLEIKNIYRKYQESENSFMLDFN